MTNRASFPITIAAAAMLCVAGPALSSTFASENSTFVYLEDIGSGGLNTRDWFNSSAVGKVAGETVRIKMQPDPTNGGRGFVPGLDARVSVPTSSKWQFGDTYIAGQPIYSVVRSQSIKAFSRNEYRTSSLGEVAPYGRYIRLAFFRPEGWLDALDGSSRDSVLSGNARAGAVNGIPLPGGGPLLTGALLCVLAARRWVSRPS